MEPEVEGRRELRRAQRLELNISTEKAPKKKVGADK